MYAKSDECALLSELSDDESIAFLKDNGVQIPTIYDEENAWAVFVRSIIKQVEDNPNVTFSYGAAVLSNFANEIKNAVNAYYKLGGAVGYSTRGTVNILEDNTLSVVWSDDYIEYNCYAYAIGDTVSRDPGEYEWISMGNSSSQYVYNHEANIYTIAMWIKDDLESLGFTVNSLTTAKPNTIVNGDTKLICVRKDVDGILIGYLQNGEAVYFHDYHLMKLENDGSWYHKPGTTIPLKYKYVPDSARKWVSEGYSLENGFFRNELLSYENTIYFIEYTKEHDYEYVYCGNNRHILTCTGCGETSGTAVSCTVRNDTCIICGNYSGGIQIMSLERVEATLK